MHNNLWLWILIFSFLSTFLIFIFILILVFMLSFWKIVSWRENPPCTTLFLTRSLSNSFIFFKSLYSHNYFKKKIAFKNGVVKELWGITVLKVEPVETNTSASSRHNGSQTMWAWRPISLSDFAFQLQHPLFSTLTQGNYRNFNPFTFHLFDTAITLSSQWVCEGGIKCRFCELGLRFQ